MVYIIVLFYISFIKHVIPEYFYLIFNFHKEKYFDNGLDIFQHVLIKIIFTIIQYKTHLLSKRKDYDHNK